jgi:hypothetical protein
MLFTESGSCSFMYRKHLVVKIRTVRRVSAALYGLVNEQESSDSFLKKSYCPTSLTVRS